MRLDVVFFLDFQDFGNSGVAAVGATGQNGVGGRGLWSFTEFWSRGMLGSVVLGATAGAILERGKRGENWKGG